MKVLWEGVMVELIGESAEDSQEERKRGLISIHLRPEALLLRHSNE